MSKYIKFLVLFLILSCSKQERTYKLLELPKFSMTIPSDWNYYSLPGIDSNYEIIVTQTSDTIVIIDGTLDRPKLDHWVRVMSLDEKLSFDSAGVAPPEEFIKFSSNPVLDQSQGIFLKEYYYLDTINNREAKFMLPKKLGQGELAILFPPKEKDGYNLFITSPPLDTAVQFDLVRAWYSIKIKE